MKWLLDTTRRTHQTGGVELADDTKCGAAETKVLECLERHSQLTARGLKRYDEVRVEIYADFELRTSNVVRPRTRDMASHSRSCDCPMDVDTLIKDKHKGTDTGKGKGNDKPSTSKGNDPSNPTLLQGSERQSWIPGR